MSLSNQPSGKLSSLSVFFPCFNEEKNIPLFLKEAMRVLPEIAKKYEVIIINDGSSDTTQQVAERWQEKYPKQIRIVNHDQNKGYGSSLQTGFHEAKYDWIFFTDGDYQFRLKELKSFVPFSKEYDVIIGYRKQRVEGFMRSNNARMYKLFIDILFRLHVKDIDCAFKLIKRSAYEKIFLESTGAFISAELLYKLKKKHFAFKQIPVDHYPRKYGNPTGANLKVILKACVESLRLYLHMKFQLFDGAKF